MIPSWKYDLFKRLGLAKGGLLNTSKPFSSGLITGFQADGPFSAGISYQSGSLPIEHEMDSLAEAEMEFNNWQINSGKEIFSGGMGAQTASEMKNLRAFQDNAGIYEGKGFETDFFGSSESTDGMLTGDFFDDDMSMSFEEIDNMASEPEITFEAECPDELENQGFAEPESIDYGVANNPMEDMGMSGFEQAPMDEMMEMEQPDQMMDYDPMDPMMNPFDPMSQQMMDPFDIMGGPGF